MLVKIKLNRTEKLNKILTFLYVYKTIFKIILYLQTMLDKEKKRFHEMAEKDKKRYDAEMQNYTPPKGEKARGKKRKQIKDPNAPKRSL